MGIMLVYDITNEKSFENIVKWLRNINEVSFYLFNFYTFLMRCVIWHCIQIVLDFVQNRMKIQTTLTFKIITNM